MSDTQSTSDSLVLRRDEHGVCHLTMNRPKAYNALSIDMMSALIEAFGEISKDKTVRVVILS